MFLPRLVAMHLCLGVKNKVWSTYMRKKFLKIAREIRYWRYESISNWEKIMLIKKWSVKDLRLDDCLKKNKINNAWK